MTRSNIQTQIASIIDRSERGSSEHPRLSQLDRGITTRHWARDEADSKLWKVCDSALDFKIQNPPQNWSLLPSAVCRYSSIKPVPGPIEMQINRLSRIEFAAAHHRG